MALIGSYCSRLNGSSYRPGTKTESVACLMSHLMLRDSFYCVTMLKAKFFWNCRQTALVERTRWRSVRFHWRESEPELLSTGGTRCWFHLDQRQPHHPDRWRCGDLQRYASPEHPPGNPIFSMVVTSKIHPGYLKYWYKYEIYTSEQPDGGLYFCQISSTLNKLKGSKKPNQKRPKCNDRATLSLNISQVFKSNRLIF